MAQHFLHIYIRLIEICADCERCEAKTTLAQLLNVLQI